MDGGTFCILSVSRRTASVRFVMTQLICYVFDLLICVQRQLTVQYLRVDVALDGNSQQMAGSADDDGHDDLGQSRSLLSDKEKGQMLAFVMTFPGADECPKGSSFQWNGPLGVSFVLLHTINAASVCNFWCYTLLHCCVDCLHHTHILCKLLCM